ncbi:DUF1667 domain-containing protein [Enterocloster bolteae]|uniref:DUF1667 domain-containing protein n=1 Tax=Enterocloster bolteae TaxID=208479 RepID=UPI0024324147|nr:DUF1667 domain-containing protein [Enterocloster bolteae]
MEKRELICIGCPMGCPLTVELENGEIKTITGYTCKKGETYARKEVTNPTRIVTSTVRVEGGRADMVSVKTREDIPKDKIFQCVKALMNQQGRAGRSAAAIWQPPAYCSLMDGVPAEWGAVRRRRRALNGEETGHQ